MQAKVKSLACNKFRTAEKNRCWLFRQIKVVILQFDKPRRCKDNLLMTSLRCSAGGQWCHRGKVTKNHKLIPENVDDANARTKLDNQTQGDSRTHLHPGHLTTNLWHQCYAMGKDKYPLDISAPVYSLIMNYRTLTNPRIRESGSSGFISMLQGGNIPEARAMMFTQCGSIAGTNGITHNGIICLSCQATTLTAVTVQLTLVEQ